VAKYGQLAQSYTFIPVAVKTLGPINNAWLEFHSECDFERRISQVSNYHRESAFLCQRLSVLIHRFTAVAIQGIFSSTHSLRTRFSSSGFLGHPTLVGKGLKCWSTLFTRRWKNRRKEHTHKLN